MAKRTVAVAGNGTVSKNAVHDLLADWLGYEEVGEDYNPTERADEVHFLFLAHPDLISKTLQYVYNWTGRANIEYTALYSKRHSAQKAVELIVENSEEALASGGAAEIYADAIEYLRGREGEKTLIILSDTDGDDGKDAGCDEFIIDASKAGIEVLDLGCALVTYPVQKAIERALGGQEDEEPEGVAAGPAPASEDLQDDIAEAHRAQEAQPPAPAADQVPPPDLASLVLKLAAAVESVIATVESCLVADFYDEKQALDSIRTILTPVREVVPEPVVEGPYPVEDEGEAEPESKAAGPKDAGSKEVRKGWFNTELNEYLPFRGRPRRDVDKHDIVQDDDGKWIKYQPEAA
ncbi:hypothetical protein [Streptomyces sp. H27-C3]|uniref:hypothetical protein n=1 Tax=Streptomyces sp. H27-C3 TaxID=3046305 RepID=UPI0024BBBFB3|nr:hypothetical protein [Streptomyces sp. H27-C3]MDJ0463151.1 hypothetical protein [Streptomyces sp. H27-C3]